jgi:DNA polymerase
MYFGGHTGRFSGSGGNLNLQNLPRNEMFGANIRHMIAAPAGKKLVAADLSNIEVRTLCWLAGDRDTLTEIATTPDIYEAFAIRFGLWSKERGLLKTDPALRHKVKALVLGCGYGAGAAKFAEMYDMPFDEAAEAVNLYRTKLHKIPSYWTKLNNDLRSTYTVAEPYTIKLASGRSLKYGKLKATKDGTGRIQYVAIMNRNGKRLPMKLWGGILAENASQAMARDILCHMMLELEKAGINVILHVHDEIVAECDEQDAEEVLKTMSRIMSTPPSWCSDLPLACEGYISQVYKK